MDAYAYLRKSSVRDPSRDVSHEVQEAAVRELATRHGDEPIILSDWDKSGRLGPDKRPGYAALLRAIETGSCRVVYSYSLSRLGRSLPELARLIEDCQRRGIPVRLHADSVDTSTASGRLLANVLGSVAAFEADVASERTRAAIAAKAARGEPVGGRLYGVGPGEDAQAVLDAYDDGGSFAMAAKLLNERGVRPRGSKKGWWPSTVANVVRRLRDMPRNGSKGVGSGPRGFLLARLLRCPCGSILSGSTDPSWGTPTVRYACRRGTTVPHQKRSVSEHLILPWIKEEAARLHTPERVVMEQQDEAKRRELEDRRARILDLWEAGHIDRQDRERRLASVHEALAELESHRAIVAIPRIDWDWGTADINAVLRAMWESVVLDDQLRPIRAGWRVPEWRASEV